MIPWPEILHHPKDARVDACPCYPIVPRLAAEGGAGRGVGEWGGKVYGGANVWPMGTQLRGQPRGTEGTGEGRGVFLAAGTVRGTAPRRRETRPVEHLWQSKSARDCGGTSRASLIAPPALTLSIESKSESESDSDPTDSLISSL